MPTSGDIVAIANEVRDWREEGLDFHTALKKVLNRYNINVGYDIFAKAVGSELGKRHKKVPYHYPKQQRRPKQLQLFPKDATAI